MLRSDVEQTIELATSSLARSKGDDLVVDHRCKDLHLESLGISEKEKECLVELYQSEKRYVDPVVSYLVGATSGYLYKNQIGQLQTYPIPNLRLGATNKVEEAFLDIGCSWGRWSIAAAQKGFKVVGVDPSLGALLAAERVSKQLGISPRFICADARFLPFREEKFSVVFSYSVFQHFPKGYVRDCLQQIYRVLTQGGVSLIQMPNVYGIRCLQHQLRRGFRQARDFEVRYWTPRELMKEFNRSLGESEISVDCYFGLGLQASDIDLMGKSKKRLIETSEKLRRRSKALPWLKFVADSLYVHSMKANINPAILNNAFNTT